MNLSTTITALVARLRSPRTLLAIVVSAAATAGVGGPLAYEAYHARDLLAAQRAGAETSERQGGGDTTVVDTTTTTELTSTSITTSSSSPTTAGDGEGTTTTSVRGSIGGRTTTTARGSVGTTPGTRPTVPGQVTTTTRPANELLILVSVAPERVPFAPLDGQQVTGLVYVFVDLSPTLVVQWRLDGSPVELRGGALDTNQISAGAHTLQATVATPLGVLDGRVGFTVAR